MNAGTILIVDDEGAILRAVKRELSELTDDLSLQTAAFENPLEALDFVRNNHESIAVLISDQKMPGMKGCDLIEKTKEINSQIVSILLTAYTDIEDIIKSIRTGIYSFILKPWNDRDLIEEVRKAYGAFLKGKNEKRHTDQLREELRWGGHLQEKFLKPDIPRDRRMTYSVSYKPHLSCGGDFYDIIRIDRDNYLFIIGDVAGHGVKAAFITFILKTLFSDPGFKFMLDNDLSLKKIMAWINMRIYKDLKNVQPLLVTLCLCLINLKTKNMTVCNGGHMYPLVLRNDKILEVEATGTALGFRTDIAYSEHAFPLRKEDRVLLYTDGLAEMNGGEKEFRDIISFYSRNPYFASVVTEEINRNRQANTNRDDMTLLSIEVHE